MERLTGRVVELNTRKSNFQDEEIMILFFPDEKEYPFSVTNGCKSFDCISWDEACDKFDHFYAYYNRPVEAINRYIAA